MFEEVLVEVRADELPAAAREAGVVQLLEERRDPGRHDRVEHDVRAARGDPLDGRAVVHVVEREVLLADDRPAVRRDDLPDARVHHVRPDVVGRRQVERLRPGLAHQPRDERVDLLRRHRAGAEDERIGLLPLVLLGVDVERLALDDGRALDRLPRGAVDAAEDDVDAGPARRASSPRPRRRRRRSRRPRDAARGAGPSRPPLALMSPMTILATLALASPTNESGPVWSAMTPTLMGSPPGLAMPP